MKILAVTACPSGVAHTYMAAEAISDAAKKAHVACKVETQGSIGIENVISEDDLVGADAVLLTTDMPIKDEERFEGLPKVRLKANQYIRGADTVIAKLRDKLGE
ncbi:PTS fructose transporter subunit IIB [Tractidigestivibacter sp.]|uniref:PTS fructose transporter subunit IIB n=1 Tax=Tractidigestivibacter sp. TaxID=2847320 RepID=UPI002A91883B|nr:fructose PTS transporter subunit IIB [Tractidigestivibacter sp.]MDY5270539.1 fructose PTS transporter subunit IIB [Tractidigestivibacter sp.]